MIDKFRFFVQGGASLFGILDTTGKLRKGEVYFEISHDLCKDQKWENCDKVQILKKPYMSESDYRVFNRVTSKKHKRRFSHLKNCIIFSMDDDNDWV